MTARRLCAVLTAGFLTAGVVAGSAATPVAGATTTSEAGATTASESRRTVAAPPRLGPADTLHIQFAGRLDTKVAARVYELDGQNSTVSTIRALHRKGRKVVCYLSAGSVEAYRPDAHSFPPAVVGKTLDGWPDERWLDVRQTGVLLPIMARRVAACAAKGFDAVEFDNVDGYANDTGFPLTRTQQVRYDRALADLAHRHRMAAVLKNAPDLVPSLVRSFDAALVEQCAQYDECAAWRPFVTARKAVWDLEYRVPYARACAAGRAARIQVQLKRLSLDAYRRAC
ncbi:MAG TPA: endo alpha-1,4 polygalactosaminidase [Mycobacteriales bacterium]|jgi:hypothetical protein|nr:endo alpha-1,4 polygalactosaminidase [Mycobacteriales bacterium]